MKMGPRSKNVTWGMPKSCKHGEIFDSFRLYEGNPINLIIYCEAVSKHGPKRHSCQFW